LLVTCFEIINKEIKCETNKRRYGNACRVVRSVLPPMPMVS
jgi:hypothetical protein